MRRMFLAVLLFFVPASALSQPTGATGGNAIDWIERKLIHVRIGLGGMKLLQGGKEIEVGAFGGDAARVFEGVPKSLEAMSTFRALKIAGLVCYGLGLGALVADFVLTFASRHAAISDGGPTPLWWGLLIGGTVVGIGGAFMFSASYGYLSDAVRAFNESLFDRARRGAMSAGAGARGVSFNLRWAF